MTALTALELACDLYVLKHLTFREDGSPIMAGRRDDWPDGAEPLDISEAIARVMAHRRAARIGHERVIRLYRESTPTEAMVTVAENETQEIPPPLLINWGGVLGVLLLLVSACTLVAGALYLWGK